MPLLINEVEALMQRAEQTLHFLKRIEYHVQEIQSILPWLPPQVVTARDQMDTAVKLLKEMVKNLAEVLGQSSNAPLSGQPMRPTLNPIQEFSLIPPLEGAIMAFRKITEELHQVRLNNRHLRERIEAQTKEILDLHAKLARGGPDYVDRLLERIPEEKLVNERPTDEDAAVPDPGGHAGSAGLP